MKYQKEIDELSMTSEMWDDLEKELSPYEYETVVKKYKNRYNMLPTCGADHGMCCHYDGHKCHYKNNCGKKINE